MRRSAVAFEEDAATSSQLLFDDASSIQHEGGGSTRRFLVDDPPEDLQPRLSTTFRSVERVVLTPRVCVNGEDDNDEQLRVSLRGGDPPSLPPSKRRMFVGQGTSSGEYEKLLGSAVVPLLHTTASTVCYPSSTSDTSTTVGGGESSSASGGGGNGGCDGSLLDQNTTRRFFDAGWDFADFNATASGSDEQSRRHFQTLLNQMMPEVSQDPVGLSLRKVDVNCRIRALSDLDHFTDHLLFFWLHKGAYFAAALILAVLYMLIPCSVPTNFTLFVFANRLLYNSFSCMTMTLTVLLFVRERLRERNQQFVVLAVLVIYNAQDLTKLYLLSSQSWFTDYLEVFNVVNWFTTGTFFYWLRRHHPAVPLCGDVGVTFVVFVAFLYAFLCLLEQFTVRFHAVVDLGNTAQIAGFVFFFVWTNFCLRIFQMAGRRIACGIAAAENRNVSWEELLRVQVFMYFGHSCQYAYYRLLFVNVASWYMEVVLIVVHLGQETLLYPVRLSESARGLERRIIARLPSWCRFAVHPVLPLSVWMDLHCADYFLRKLAEVATLFLFVAQLLLFRYGYMGACYTPATFTEQRYEQLLVVTSILLVVELVSGLVVVHRVLYRKIGRGFLFHQLVRPRLHRTFVFFSTVVINCSVVFADALRHVDFSS